MNITQLHIIKKPTEDLWCLLHLYLPGISQICELQHLANSWNTLQASSLVMCLELCLYYHVPSVLERDDTKRWRMSQVVFELHLNTLSIIPATLNACHRSEMVKKCLYSSPPPNPPCLAVLASRIIICNLCWTQLFCQEEQYRLSVGSSW